MADNYRDGRRIDNEGDQYVEIASRLAGERNEDSTTGTDYTSVSGEWAISSAIAAGTGATVYNGPAVLGGIWVETTIGTAAPTLTDGGTTRLSVPIAIPIGMHDMLGVIFATNLVVAAGASATGSIRVLYRPLDTGVTWAY